MGKKTGTREWSDYSINICKGCAHGCRYCYGREMAMRFGRIGSGDEWTVEVVDEEKVEDLVENTPRKKGRGMFPTTHDITPGNVDSCLRVIRALVEEGNELLLTTKGNPQVVRRLCDELYRWKDQLMWRFTITHINSSVGEFWEPGAPPIVDRFASIRRAHDCGYETSVSMEPLLQPKWSEFLVCGLTPYVTDTIWIGKMRNIAQRTAWMTGHPDGPRTLEAKSRVEGMERLSGSYHCEKVYEHCKAYDNVRWKDSYQKELGIDRFGNRTECDSKGGANSENCIS